MRALPLALLATILLPLGLSAATIEGGRSLVVSDAPAGNTYLYGADLTLTAPVTGDLSALGGTLTVSAPVSGDALLLGGTVDVKKPVLGDVRALGGTVHIEDSVTGDVAAAGGAVTVDAAPSFAWVAGGKVVFTHGANGPVTVYGNTVTLSGTFTGNVKVIASDGLTLGQGTVIHGALEYDAPQQADIPTDAVVDGGVTYTGKSFLPTTQEARTFAVAGAGVFFLVRIIAVIIAAGLIAGLFPRLAQAVADHALPRSRSRFVLLTLLGFGVIVATPVFILILLASFAGAAVALLVGAAYLLLMLLSYLYAAVIAGGALSRLLVKRPLFLWRDAVLGMLALSLVTLVPVVGWLVLLILFAAACGTLVSLLYRSAFPKDEDVLHI
ncbi:MAG TPA: polymer-forming cytoskeletal protein [Candidatus Paceibacterota bacterium]|nr:polymer-forming cytoskeletal protein [Candidatus Paceibacterota bacterium]